MLTVSSRTAENRSACHDRWSSHRDRHPHLDGNGPAPQCARAPGAGAPVVVGEHRAQRPLRAGAVHPRAQPAHVPAPRYRLDARRLRVDPGRHSRANRRAPQAHSTQSAMDRGCARGPRAPGTGRLRRNALRPADGRRHLRRFHTTLRPAGRSGASVPSRVEAALGRGEGRAHRLVRKPPRRGAPGPGTARPSGSAPPPGPGKRHDSRLHPTRPAPVPRPRRGTKSGSWSTFRPASHAPMRSVCAVGTRTGAAPSRATPATSSRSGHAKRPNTVASRAASRGASEGAADGARQRPPCGFTSNARPARATSTGTSRSTTARRKPTSTWSR